MISTQKMPPLIQPCKYPTSKKCGNCGAYFDHQTVKREAVKKGGLYWWNCPCGNTPAVKESFYD